MQRKRITTYLAAREGERGAHLECLVDLILDAVYEQLQDPGMASGAEQAPCGETRSGENGGQLGSWQLNSLIHPVSPSFAETLHKAQQQWYALSPLGDTGSHDERCYSEHWHETDAYHSLVRAGHHEICEQLREEETWST